MPVTKCVIIGSVFPANGTPDYFLMEQLPWIPHFARIPDAGHHPVKADCIRLTPTSAVQRSHHLLTQTARATLIKIKLPAMILVTLSIVIPNPLFVKCVFSRETFLEFFYTHGQDKKDHRHERKDLRPKVGKSETF